MLPVSSKYYLPLIGLVLVLQGCGDQDRGELRGVFLDGPVSGLKYTTRSGEGYTEPDGSFYYDAGDRVVFSIGQVKFKAVTGAATITPLDIAQADDVENEKTVNVLRLLQSMDADRNAANGISIPEQIHQQVMLPDVAFDGGIDANEFIGQIVDQAYDDQRTIVTPEAAIAHFVDTLSQVAASEPVSEEVLPSAYLSLQDQGGYDGTFLSIEDSQYSLNIDGEWESGTVESNHDVLHLKSYDGENRFLTSGTRDNQLLFCIDQKPAPVDGCEGTGKLFAAFDDENSAVVYEPPDTEVFSAEGSIEPGIGAAQESATDHSANSATESATGVEANQSEVDTSEVEEPVENSANSGQSVPPETSRPDTSGESPEAPEPTNSAVIPSVPDGMPAETGEPADPPPSDSDTTESDLAPTTQDSIKTDTSNEAVIGAAQEVEINSSASTTTGQEVIQPEVDTTDTNNADDNDRKDEPAEDVKPDNLEELDGQSQLVESSSTPVAEEDARETRVIQTTTDCPSSLTAPAQFSVFADPVEGCKWTDYDLPSWSWSPASSYSSATNLITVAEGGTYRGEFEYPCTYEATGETVLVQATCLVEVLAVPAVTENTVSQTTSELPEPVQPEPEQPEQPGVEQPDVEEPEAELPEVIQPEAPEVEVPEPEVQEPEDQETRVLQTTSACPISARAPAEFTVYADEPVECEWTNFDSPPWSWNPAASYDSATNTITASEGGRYEGVFEHSCIDQNTGELVIVKSSCVVDVDDPLGIADITDLFFVTGQSNASGMETAYDATIDLPDSRVYAFTDSGWQVANLNQNWEVDLPGNYSATDTSRTPYNHIGFQLSKSIAAKADRVVGLVVLTAPGEGISHWDYNSEFFVAMRQKATAALNALPHKSEFDAMIWMQGETDWLFEGTADPGATGFPDTNSDEYLSYYPNKLFQLISNLRSEYWFGYDGRFICAETKKASLNAHLMALNTDEDAYTACAAASDLPTRGTDPYGNHFSAESFRTLGGRIADIYLDMDE